MGKSKRKSKLSSLRHKSSPIVSSSADCMLTDMVGSAVGDQLLPEIQAKLTSGKPSDRHLAADMIANSMVDFDQYSDQDLVKLIRTLSPICVERVENCRNAAIDSLCYLSSISDRLCDLMVGADLLTPLIALFNRYFGPDFDWCLKPKSELIFQFYVNSCRLLTNLCGTSSKALNIFNNSNLTQILINGLKAFEANIEVSIASAQCLSVVVEENRIPELLIEENIELIKNLIQKPTKNSSELYLSNLCLFIANNLDFGSESGALAQVFQLIDHTLSVSPLELIREFAHHIRQFLENEKTIDLLNENFSELKNLVLAKRVALELITNITGAADECTGDEEELMDCDDDMDDSEDEIEDNVRQNGCLNGSSVESTVPPELEKILLEQNILQKVCEHFGSVEEELALNLSKHHFGKEILNCVQSAQLCALTCVHNLVENISNEKLVISEQIWKHIYGLALNSETNNEINRQLFEESTNTMRAIISRNPGISLSADELEKLCVFGQKFNSNSSKINLINLMSVLAQRSTDLLFIEKIAVLLMTGLQTESDLVLKAELFDALIDIFSEDFKTDSIAIKLDLINRMKGSALVFKKEANKSAELKHNPIVSTVKLNLMPFIKYKQKMLNK